MIEQRFKADAIAHRWLESHGDGWQYGEQGILDAMLGAIGDGSRRCMEIGAGDGYSLPVTVDRLIQRGWQCRLYEIAEYRQKMLRSRYGERAEVLGAWNWTPGGWIDDGVVVIDIDGQDGIVLEQLLGCASPAIVLCEHYDRMAPSHPGDLEQSKIPPRWLLGKTIDGGFAIQAGTAALQAIASAAGYSRIGLTRVNSIFVRDDLKRRLFHV